jgi:hypothetical protein
MWQSIVTKWQVSVMQNAPCCDDLTDRFRLPFQPVDATQALNLSAGVSKFNVFLGRSFSCLATASNFDCE